MPDLVVQSKIIAEIDSKHMQRIPRMLHLREMLKNKSYFLFGPRQTGKSWLIQNTLQDCKSYNLLESETYLKLSRAPQSIREETNAQNEIVIIDEIQRLPILLNEIHLLIESRRTHFLLTGSSARSLRKKGVNLLGGRARTCYLHPFSYLELGEPFDLPRALNHGLLPAIYLSNEPETDLKSYVGTYLQEEIAAEGLTRNIPAFSRFLEVAALCNGNLINYTKISNDAQVARSTVQEYFQILKDTLIAFEVTSWRGSRKRKAISTGKFYFFDVGVVRFLQNRSLVQKNSPEFGELFETYLFHELKTFADYAAHGEVSYWRSTSGFEVDFILGYCAIEIKASSRIGEHDLKGLRALREEGILKKYIVVCQEAVPRVVDGIEILPWNIFLQKLWAREFD